MTVDILIGLQICILTGFDAPRLKAFIFGRKMKTINLFKLLLRLNRPYPGMRYGCH